jgi:hypothetical protein
VMPYPQAAAYHVLWSEAVVVEEGALTGVMPEPLADEPEHATEAKPARHSANRSAAKPAKKASTKPAAKAAKKAAKSAKKASAKKPAAKKPTAKKPAAKKPAPKKKKGSK